MNTKKSSSEIIEFLVRSLGCTKNKVANLINVSEKTLLDNKVANDQLRNLYLVVDHFYCLGIPAVGIMEIITAQVHEYYKGRMDSISSAISLEKYSLNILMDIGSKSYERYIRVQAKRNLK